MSRCLIARTSVVCTRKKSVCSGKLHLDKNIPLQWHCGSLISRRLHPTYLLSGCAQAPACSFLPLPWPPTLSPLGNVGWAKAVWEVRRPEFHSCLCHGCCVTCTKSLCSLGLGFPSVKGREGRRDQEALKILPASALCGADICILCGSGCCESV